MDLGTILNRNTALKYTTADGFLHDVRLIWEAAATYNGMNSSVTMAAERIYNAAEDTVSRERDEFDRLEQRRIRDSEESRMGRLTDAQIKAREQDEKEEAARRAEKESKAAVAQVALGGGGGVLDAAANNQSAMFNLVDMDSDDDDSSDDSDEETKGKAEDKTKADTTTIATTTTTITTTTT